jgi:hypothetical protein
MNGRVSDFVFKLKSNPRIKSFDEASTKQALVLPLLQLLDWNPFDVDEVMPEYSIENRRVDFSLRLNNRDEVFIEVKKAGEGLENHQEQLLDYSFRQGVELAILSNGITWWFYLPMQKGNWQDRKFYTIDILQQSAEDIESKFLALLSKENVKNGNALKHAKAIYTGKQKKKAVEETLPEAWNKIITEPDALLVELLAETTEKLCGFKPEGDEVLKFLNSNSEDLVLLLEYESPEPKVTVKAFPRKSESVSVRTGNSKISQDDLIPYIVKVLHKHGGSATKNQVEDEIYQMLKGTFSDDWFQGKVSHGVPRWKHFIAFAKERAKLLHGYVKSARESGRGVWELTAAGEKYYHTIK